MKTKKESKKEMVKAESLVPKTMPSEEMEVLGYIKEGLSKDEIRVIYKSWGTKKFSALWLRASNLMKQALSDQDEARAQAVTRYLDLYKQNYNLGYLKECRNVLDSLCKVQGLTKDNVAVANEFNIVWK